MKKNIYQLPASFLVVFIIVILASGFLSHMMLFTIAKRGNETLKLTKTNQIVCDGLTEKMKALSHDVTDLRLDLREIKGLISNVKTN